MNKEKQLWKSLQDTGYRHAFAEDIGIGLAFQIRLLREKQSWSQQELANRIGKRQETISQWENPAYGRYTLNTLKELAAAFDVALIVKFAPFSELVDWTASLTPQRLTPPSFEHESSLGINKPTNTMLQGYVENSIIASQSSITVRQHTISTSLISGIVSGTADYQTNIVYPAKEAKKEREYVGVAAA